MNCPTAAYHGWEGCKSKTADDPFLKFLAKEGETVGRMAHRLFVNGESLAHLSLYEANEETRQRIAHGDCTLFESCITHMHFTARPDVLIRKGNKIFLIEVKSKVGNIEQHRAGKMLVNYYGNIRAAYREIVHDLAFQAILLERVYPAFTIIPYFLLPDECTVYLMDHAEMKEAEIDRRSKAILQRFTVGK